MQNLFTFHGIGIESIILRLLRIATIILLGILSLRFIRISIRRLMKLRHGDEADRSIRTQRRAETLAQMVQSGARVVVMIITGMMIAEQLGISLAPLIAGAGILGLAVGFGAQTLVKDVITGFFILFENQFGLGDLIEVDGATGMVEAMNLRTTTVRDLQGRAHIIPNSSIQKVTVLSKEWSRAVVDFPVSYEADFDRVMAIMEEEGQNLAKAWPSRVIETPEILGIEKLGEDTMTIRIIAKTAPGQHEEVARELRKRLKQRFDREGIELPPPPKTVWLRQEPKQPDT